MESDSELTIEEAPSRLAKSRPDRKAEEQTWQRKPALVPRAEDFFKTPARTFIPLSQQDTNFGQGAGDASVLRASSEDGATKKLDILSGSQNITELHKEGDSAEEDTSAEYDDEAHLTDDVAVPANATLAVLPTQKDHQSEAARQQDMRVETTPTTEIIHKDGESTPSIEDDLIPVKSLSEQTFRSDSDEAGLPLAAFSNTEEDRSETNKECEVADDDDLPIPIQSLSDKIYGRILDETGLPIVASGIVGGTRPETINKGRWDFVDDEESDIELEEAFGPARPQNPHPLRFGDAKSDLTSCISPFAPYVSTGAGQPYEPSDNVEAPNQPASKSEAIDHHEAKESNDGSAFLNSPFAQYLSNLTNHISTPSAKEAEGNRPDTAVQQKLKQKNEETASDSDDMMHVLGGMAAAAASSLLKKSLLDHEDTDSGDESNASNNLERQSAQPAPQKSIPANGSGRTTPYSSDDGLTFDEGAGVGIGSRPFIQTPLKSEWWPSSDASSEPSSPRFTTAEKGKQVQRGSQPLFTTKKGIQENNEQRAQIYPAAPPEPWKSEPMTNKLSQRRLPTIPTAVATAAVSSNDHNLAIMSSARKQASAVPPAVAGVKSLFSDYPDAPSKPASTTAKPVVTLPADPSTASTLKGQYELPSIKKIDQWKSKNSLAPNAFRRLLINISALILSHVVMKGRFYRTVVRILSSFVSPSVFYWTEWAVILLLLFNILEVLNSYMRSSNNFEYLPLTPSQRTLLGLDPIITKVPGAVPVFKKSISVPYSLTEKPIVSTYVSPSQGPFVSSRTPFQKPAVGLSTSEYRDATTILNKSMARSFNQPTIQDRADLDRLMKIVEARDELQAEWKGVDTDPSKRPFGLHGNFASQAGLQTGVDMSVDNALRPDLQASLNARGSITRYQPAIRTTLSKDQASKTDLQKDGLYVVGHGKVLKNLKVSEQQLDRWVFNMRQWMWNTIVKNVCSEMVVVDAELARQGLSYLDCKSATMFYTSVPPPNTANGSAPATSTAAAPAASAPLSSSLAWGAASIANTRLPSAFAAPQPQQPQLPTSLPDLEARYGQSPIVKQRLVLEMYLAIPGYANRKYVVERLQAMGPLLTHFIWDSHGVTWDGGKKTWTPDLPTDAQIIMHLFAVYMDLAMPSQPAQANDRFPFSYKHYVPMEGKPDPTTRLQIKQTSKSPPEYSLVVEGSMWEVVPKRLNVWYTLVLFIFIVMRESGGYIGQINIGTRLIGLGDVVEGYDV